MRNRRRWDPRQWDLRRWDPRRWTLGRRTPRRWDSGAWDPRRWDFGDWNPREWGPRQRGLAALALTGLLVAALAARSLAIARDFGRPFARPAPGNGMFQTLAGAADFATGTLDRVTVDASGALVLDPAAGLSTGTDTTGDYNGGSFFYGTYLSPEWNSAVAVNSVVASWSADTPDGTWLQVEARALQGDTWTKYYNMGVWASGTSTVRRHSAGEQADAGGFVDTDDLRLTRAASAVQLRVTLFTTDPSRTPRVRRLSVVATGPGSGLEEIADRTGTAQPFRRAWGVDLPVPEMRQNDFPDGAGWCSPTSVAMLTAYWANLYKKRDWRRSVPETAAGVRDYEYGGTGNWVFNTAYAASLGFDAYVTRYDSLAGIERWIAAGVPVAINIEFGPGELDGAPMPQSDGHIIVIRGFDRRGNPIANDPASRRDQGEKVRIVYNRDQLERAWQGRAEGTVYIIYPPGHRTP